MGASDPSMVVTDQKKQSMYLLGMAVGQVRALSPVPSLALYR